MSLTSLGMGLCLEESGGSGLLVSRLMPEESALAASLEPFYDYVAYVIFCSQHQKVALRCAIKDDEIKSLWMPFVALPTDKKWVESTKDGIDLVLGKFESRMGYHHSGSKESLFNMPVKKSKRIKIYRLQVPGTQKFITRLIHLVVLGSGSNACCDNNKDFFWCPLNDILTNNVGKLWGPEVKEYASVCKEANPKGRVYGEYALRDAYKCKDEKVVTSARISGTNIDSVYYSFLEFLFPAFFMNFHSFREFFNKYEQTIDTTSLKMLFNAFDSDRNGYLKFNDFLLGLACFEPSSAHNETRVRFVFRFYDTDCDDVLSHLEFKRLVKDLNPKDSDDAILKKMTEGFKVFEATNKIPLKDFVGKVNKSKFKGTETLCRSSESILRKISDQMSSRSQLKLDLAKGQNVKVKSSVKGKCNQCKAKDFKWHHFGVIIQPDCTIGGTFRVTNPEEPDADQIYETKFTFNETGVASIIMDLLHEFNPRNGQFGNTKGFLTEPKDKIPFIQYLKKLSVILIEIFAAEDRVIKINQPAYIIGDIGGNLTDLSVAMEKIFWRMYPVLRSSYVFLGNYLEPGKFGFECILYLFILKILSPNKIILLRGRHEVQKSQTTFKKECIAKYDQKNGKIIYDIINNLLDRLPIAAVINEQIFCVNSGITNTGTKTKDYKKFGSTISDPFSSNKEVIQLLYNEPVKKLPEGSKPMYGFVKNPTREHSLLFDGSAFKSFLKRNGFEWMVTANNKDVEGFDLFFEGRLLQVSSNSQMKDRRRQKMKCAVCLVNYCKFQIIQVEDEDLNANRSLLTTRTELSNDDTRTVVSNRAAVAR